MKPKIEGGGNGRHTFADSVRALQRKDEEGYIRPEVYDPGSGLLLARADDGELVVTLEQGDQWVSENFRLLVANDCAGMRGKELQDGLALAMRERLSDKYRRPVDQRELDQATAADRKIKENKEDF